MNSPDCWKHYDPEEVPPLPADAPKYRDGQLRIHVAFDDESQTFNEFESSMRLSDILIWFVQDAAVVGFSYLRTIEFLKSVTGPEGVYLADSIDQGLYESVEIVAKQFPRFQAGSRFLMFDALEITAKHQGKGFGNEAMRQIIEAATDKAHPLGLHLSKTTGICCKLIEEEYKDLATKCLTQLGEKMGVKTVIITTQEELFGGDW